MSQTITDTTQDDARQAAATEPSATETQTAPETKPETPTTDPAPGAEPPKPAVEDKPQLTREQLTERALRKTFHDQRMAERKLQLVQEQLDRLQPRDPNAPPSQAEFDRQVEQRAAAMLEARENEAKSQAWITKGNAEFSDFTERCNELASMGAGENPAFMAAIGRLPEGHKVIAELSANPADTARILQLPPVDLAIELASMAHRIATAPPPPPKPTTQAPPPIRPLATASRAEVNLNTLDGDAFLAAWNKKTRAK